MRRNSTRCTIHVPAGSTTNQSIYNGGKGASILGSTTGWTLASTYYYNSSKNVYVYFDL